MITADQIMTAKFWTQAEGEEETVRTFALIPDEFEGQTSELPIDDQVFYWCDSKEWLALGAGEVFGDVEVLACACNECESETRECELCGSNYYRILHEGDESNCECEGECLRVCDNPEIEEGCDGVTYPVRRVSNA